MTNLGHTNRSARRTIAGRRFAAIVFDDGFQRAAEIAAPILKLYGFYASFYVVTSWVGSTWALIRDPYNLGRVHGTWEFWRRVAALGHEVGSHTFSHINVQGLQAKLCPWVGPLDMWLALRQLKREIPANSYTISMPWNASTRISKYFAKKYYSACVLGDSDARYVDFSHSDLHALASWAPEPRHSWNDYVKAVQQIPDGSALIFQFHSFGDEGWYPITKQLLDSLCGLLAEQEVEVRSVQKLVEMHKCEG